MAMDIPDSAVALRLGRFIGRNDMRLYVPVEFARGKTGVEVMYSRCNAIGGVQREDETQAGLCDVLDRNGDILCDFPLTKRGVEYLKTRLSAKVEFNE